ncbi:MAG: hypothetical protein ACFFE8_13815 [Candidatus Heimdallarchaeota archaeon]
MSFFIVPGFENVDHGEVRRILDLVQSVIAFSQGQSLDKKAIGRITKKLGARMFGSELFPGGSSVLFAWRFPIEKLGAVVVKPYYSGTITRLLIHYFTQIDYFQTYKDKEFLSPNGKVILLNIPQVVGFAKIETFNREFPTLLVEEAVGESIQTNPTLIRQVSQIARQMASEGLIFDFYPSNWKLHGKKLTYVDLLSSNKLKNLKKRITQLLEKIESPAARM